MDQKTLTTIYDKGIYQLPTIDDLRKNFEEYKKRRDAELKTEIEHLNKTCKGFEKQYSELRKEIQVMRNNLGMQHVAPLEGEKRHTDDEGHANRKTLEVTCKSATCVFKTCGRRISSQLMLLHYLSDHGAYCASKHCHELIEGDCARIVFMPKLCKFRENNVLGLLVLGESYEDEVQRGTRCPVFYNSFLPERDQHLDSHIPVIVMFCRTSICAALKDRVLASRIAGSEKSKDDIFVIWLFTPSNQKINAALRIKGADENFKYSTVVSLRKMCDSQIPEDFMPFEHNYWRLSYADMEYMSNNFKDKLFLKVSLIRCRPT